MLINPATVEILLRYVATLCGQLDEYEGQFLSHEKHSSGRGRGKTAGMKELQLLIESRQKEVESVCQLLVAMGKHSARSFSEVAGRTARC